MDPAGNIQYLNTAWQLHAGQPPAPYARGTWAQMIADEDRDTAMSQLVTVAVAGRRTDFEGRLLDGQGRPRWFLLSLQLYQGSPEESACLLCVAIDIHPLKLREQELQLWARIRTDMLNISVDCIKLISADGRLIHMNRAGCIALGVPEGSSFGMEWLPLLPPEVGSAGEQALAEARHGRPARFPGRSELPGQPPQYWDNMLTPVKGGDGRISAILCVSREVTAERRAQDSLQQSQERLAVAAHLGGLGVWDYDLQHDVLNIDEACYGIMGRDPKHSIRSIAQFQPCIHPEDVERVTGAGMTANGLVATNSNDGIVFRIIRPNGDIRWVRSAASVIHDGAGGATRAIGFVIDITDSWRGQLALRDANRALEEEKESLARQTLEDPLTGIANRRFLDSELARICVQANHLQHAVSIAMVDVDYFKSFNDHYGHLKGDEALRRVAEAIQSIARRSDVVARYGGEEFIIVLPGMDAPGPVLARLNAAIEALGMPHALSPFGKVTVSCGCAVLQPAGDFSSSALLKACDSALYEAKASGRNRYIINTRSCST